MKAPTKRDYETVIRVLRYLRPKAAKLAEHTDQERPSEWSNGIGAVLGLVRTKDPEKVLSDYHAEYEAGR